MRLRYTGGKNASMITDTAATISASQVSMAPTARGALGFSTRMPMGCRIRPITRAPHRMRKKSEFAPLERHAGEQNQAACLL